MDAKSVVSASAKAGRETRTATGGMQVWRIGEEVEITPANGEPSARGDVVYCHKFDNVRFFVGLEMRAGSIPWSILRRFDGVS